MAKKTRNVESLVDQWIVLGDYFYRHYERHFSKPEKLPKLTEKEPAAKADQSTIEARRRFLWAHVNNLLDKEPEYTSEELANWERLGRIVLAHIERFDPGWCGDGMDNVNVARGLLGLPKKGDIAVKLQDVDLPAGVDIEDISENDLRVSITYKGKPWLQNHAASEVGQDIDTSF